MNTCPFTNQNTACSLPGPKTEGSNGHTPTVAYCKQCSHVAFRCANGHWNRTFARFCTQCPKKLEKPATWDMASANPQRTATFSADLADVNLGLNSGVVNTPPIETSENLPGILVIDGLFILPNPNENRFEACTIVNTKNSIRLHHQWGIDFNNTPLTYGSTPIYHGLHLYSVVSGGIQKTNVISGKTELINNITGRDAAQIKPLAGCAPLKCEVNGKPTMIAGVKQGVLLFDFANNTSKYIPHSFFHEEEGPLSPTLCGSYIVFTSKRGGVLSFDVGIHPFKRKSLSAENMSFSAPVSLNGLIYFEVLNAEGIRTLACFNPNSGRFTKAADIDNEPIQNLDAWRALFTHPLLTDGKRLYLPDGSGYVVHTYDSDKGPLPTKPLPNSSGKNRFIPHQSTVVNNQIYSAHSAGLTVWDPNRNHHVQTHSLSMGNSTTPTPIARPIRYGGKLFILCKDRLICQDY